MRGGQALPVQRMGQRSYRLKPFRQVSKSRRPKPGVQTPASRKRGLIWAGGVATIAVGAFTTAFMTSAGNSAYHAASTQIETGDSVLVDSVTRLENNEDDTHLSARTSPLPDNDLAQLNSLRWGTPAYQKWFDDHQAVDHNTTVIGLLVEGNRDHPVRILNIEPVVDCGPPLSGTLFLSPPAGADGTMELDLDLDHPFAPIAFNGADGQPASGPDFFGRYTVSLKQGEQYDFHIKATTHLHSCAFTLNMTVVDGDTTLIEHIDNHGKPFRVSADLNENSDYKVVYVGGVMSQRFDQSGKSLWYQVDPSKPNLGLAPPP